MIHELKWACLIMVSANLTSFIVMNVFQFQGFIGNRKITLYVLHLLSSTETCRISKSQGHAEANEWLSHVPWTHKDLFLVFTTSKS